VEPAVHADPLTGPAAAARAGAGPGLYVHVPFCATRCTYCDFSSGALSAAAVERYLAGMEREAAARAPAAAGLEFRTVFYGGGTPSALSARHFRRLDRALRDHFRFAPGAEVTLEANPESVRPALLDAWAGCGVNRLSMGAQSVHADELAALGRIHPPQRPAEALAMARAHGYGRLSLDLMFAFPGHDRARWTATLEWLLALDPGHVSAYCFIPEAGTPLGDAVRRRERVPPPEDEQAALYDLLTGACSRAGYAAYETSNFCRPGQEARHNLGYWLRREYVGLGPSAHGWVNGERYGNHYALARWAADVERGVPPEASREAVAGDEAAREMLLLGLRLADGLRPEDHPAADWSAFLGRYRETLGRAVATGRLEPSAVGWRIPAGLRFVADDVIAWVDAAADDAAARRSRPAAPGATAGRGLTVSGIAF
jgi:oxygen-independent coproporphyrinogen-3 oxidase